MNRKNEPEIHLFVIWEKGRYKENEIISNITSNFEVIQTFSITWTPYLVNRNFTRFYDTKLPNNSQKELYAGTGEFKLIVVRDNNPNYDFRLTSKGRFMVNANMFDAKAMYRELTGGGHKIHCTNDKEELRHDLVMLLGLSLKDFLNKYDTPDKNDDDIVLVQDLPGTNGWNSFDELFYVLNECNEYLVLRNSDKVSLEYFKKNKGDVDLLVKDRNRCLFLLGDLSCIDSSGKEDSKISIDNKIVLFELYEKGKNLFHEQYENHLFKSKVLNGEMYCLPEELEFYTMLYHALLFHKHLSQKHYDRIEAKLKELNIQLNEINQKSLLDLLANFFLRNGFLFIAPDDGDIYFNFDLLEGNQYLKINKKRPTKFGLYLRKIIQIKAFERYTKIIFLRPLGNEIDLVLSFRFRYFKKELRIALGDQKKY